MFYYVYILQLRNNTNYVGFTENLLKRLNDHKKGKVITTRRSRPVKLVFYAAFLSKIKAFQFEKYLKTSSGFAFRNKRLV